ncbi:hypothetical protein CHUAL_007043 [Chamberlinius hualienensis]
MENINWARRFYSKLWEYRDVRVDGWCMMDSIKPILLLLTLYYVMIIYGPKLMNNRSPFKLKWLLFTYNMAVAIINFHIFKILLVGTTRLGYNWICEPIRFSTDPEEIKLAEAGHLYLMSKVLEFLDTLFIIIRKKNNQLSFLHVYHHSTMLLITWIVARWTPGGSILFAGLVNSFVHVAMYSYYGLSAFGPTISKYLWWKKYLTIVQLFQFLWGFTFGINMCFIGCDFPKWLLYIGVVYTLSYLILFGNFYTVTYGVQKTNPLKADNGFVKQSFQNQLMNSDSCYRRAVDTLAKTGG